MVNWLKMRNTGMNYFTMLQMVTHRTLTGYVGLTCSTSFSLFLTMRNG